MAENDDKAKLATVSKEWGTPDWRDLNAYEESDWSIYRWRWEFYRRRSDLREYFDHNAELTHKRDLELIRQGAVIGPLKGPLKLPCEPGFCASGSEDATRRFGYLGIPNPRIGTQPEGLIRPLKNFGRYYRLVEGRRLESSLGTMLSQMTLPGFSLTQDQKSILLNYFSDAFEVRLLPDEVSMKFELDEPIEPQLEEARQILREHQKNLMGKQLQKRRHKQKWGTYLRVLDARETGATWAEIAEYFYSHGFLARHTNPESGYEPPPPQAARDLWDQAKHLCYNFPV